MKTGIELIAEERAEQIEKHGRTTEHDKVVNSDLQLTWMAMEVLKGERADSDFPVDWNYDICIKMVKKSYKERLIIAGALIAAEIDRLQNS